MFSLNPVTMIKNEVAKLDPDLHKQLLEVESIIESIGPMVAKFDVTDLEALIALLPPSMRAKLSAAEVAAISAGIAALPGKLIEIEAGLKALAAAL